MDGQGDRQKIESAPRWEIPNAWLGGGHCPICGGDGLQIYHLKEYPDYFACHCCEISFEVENGGKLVRLKHIPDDMDQVYDHLRFRWVEIAAIRELALKDRPSLAHKQKEPETLLPAGPLTDEEVMRRAVAMLRLGNKPKMVETILLQAGATPEQAERAFQHLKSLQVQAEQRQSGKFIWIVAIALVLILAVSAGLYFSGWFDARRQDAIIARSTPSEQLLLKQVQERLPDSVIYRTGPGAAECPGSPADAARLFGGSTEHWERANPYTWQLTSVDRMVTVMVPDGMTVAYFKNPTLEFVNGYGPLTITNVNMAMITCE